MGALQDRVAEDSPPNAELLHQEKAALQQDSILVVLGSLHAILKGLWAFKVGQRTGSSEKWQAIYHLIYHWKKCVCNCGDGEG